VALVSLDHMNIICTCLQTDNHAHTHLRQMLFLRSSSRVKALTSLVEPVALFAAYYDYDWNLIGLIRCPDKLPHGIVFCN